jgi:Spy/CpxP family protein refolding chaperone
MAVVALAATLNASTLIAADGAGAADKPKQARKEGTGGDQARERVRDRMQQVAKELDLTEEQKTQLRPIFKKEGEKLKALRDDQGLTREQRQEKAKAIREELRKEVKPVLTAEQWEKWEKMRQERSPQRQPRPGQGAPAEKAK